MIDHFGIQAADLGASSAFYDAVLAPLGQRRVMDFEVAIGYGDQDHPGFWIGRWENQIPNRPIHVAFAAPSRDAVLAFHQAATAQGMETLHEPRVWPEYHDNYFAVFVRDPDGNNVEAVCHQP
jgi:catechol 2,3-dioxygenase-like lactoylglutathione lyase family enzyme